MEMKVYERQVTKQAISKRVIDEQQIDRHYNQSDLAELYKCDLKPSNRPIPLVPKDVLLGELLQKYDKHIYQYHEHQSLLENKEEDCLTEEERKAAWEEFENEKVNRISTNTVGPSYSGANLFNTPLINSALTNIVRRDNPTWSEVQIKGIIPALLQQLKMQLSEGDYSVRKECCFFLVNVFYLNLVLFVLVVYTSAIRDQINGSSPEIPSTNAPTTVPKTYD